MKRITIIAAMAALLLAGMGRLNAQRPIGDTIVGAEPTYMYYVYDWWRCASHEAEAPQWYAIRQDGLFGYAYQNSTAVYDSYNATHPGWLSTTHCETGSHVPHDWTTCNTGNNIRGVQMVTDRPIKILGVAACGYAQEPSDTTVSCFLYELDLGITGHLFPNMRDTTLAGRNTDSLMLLVPTAGGPSYLAGGPWRVENAHRYIPLPTRIDALTLDMETYAPDWTVRPFRILDTTPVVPIYEVMFDKPQVVTDSFIVAGTGNNNEGSYRIQYAPGMETMWENMWLWDKRPTRYWEVYYFYHSALVGMTDLGYSESSVLWYKYRDVPWLRIDNTIDSNYSIRNHPGLSYSLHIPVILPIIDPDFDTVLCDRVRDVRVADSTDTTLTLMWNGGNAVQWEVVYAEVNSPTANTVTTTAPMVTLTGLRERTNYMVRVRGMCEWDTEYGPWSDILDVWTGAHHDTPVSISNLDRFTQMMPNPARGQVTVLSSYRLSRVVVYDLSGHSVLEHEDEGLATTFDVSGLAKGVYVVAIHTPAGIATKRLVVE